jgi:copper chaperone CopZ
MNMADINTTDLQTYVKSLINDVISGKKEIIMEKQDFTIPNISCDHCVAAIKNELGDMEGIKSVKGDPSSKTVTVEWEAPASTDRILSKLAEINYPAS